MMEFWYVGFGDQQRHVRPGNKRKRLTLNKGNITKVPYVGSTRGGEREREILLTREGTEFDLWDGPVVNKLIVKK